MCGLPGGSVIKNLPGNAGDAGSIPGVEPGTPALTIPLYSLSLNYLRCLIISIGFSGCSDSKESAFNAGDLSLIPGSGRFPGGGNCNPLQFSCLENPMGRGAWWVTVQGLAKESNMM